MMFFWGGGENSTCCYCNAILKCVSFSFSLHAHDLDGVGVDDSKGILNGTYSV